MENRRPGAPASYSRLAELCNSTRSCGVSALNFTFTSFSRHQQLEGESCLLHTGTSNSKDINNLLLLKFGLQGER